MKIKALIQKIISSFSFWIHHPHYLLLALFFTLIHMLCLFMIIKVLVVGLNEAMPFWKIAGLWSLTYFITLIPVSINGLGLQELSFINLFTVFGGISGPTGLSIALIIRVLMMIGSIPGAFFVSSILSGDTYTKISQENH
ncbi:MAG: flippase-like domain-containing protein [Anaerolineaceae bacterium]|nr:flippase-like domain-containing protein [Anaerolineaceae bacterium]